MEPTRITRSDLAVAGAVTVFAIAGLLLGTLVVARPAVDLGVLGVAAAVAQGAVLVLRRTRPVTTLVVATAVVTLHALTGDPNVGSELGPYVAAYAVGAYASGWRGPSVAALAALALATVGAGPAVAAGPPPPGDLPRVVTTGLVIAVLVLLGRVVRARREAASARVRRAIEDERVRIARELHDVVAHHVGGIVIQASAARRVLDRDPAGAREALERIERSGREALTAMPVLLGALRGEAPGGAAPQPRLAGLEELVRGVDGAGLRVALRTEGEPRPLPAAVELSAYRIVQEALTNASKHAGPARVTVVVRYRPDALEVEVADDGRGAAAEAPARGHGIMGMRERAALLGGELVAGPGPGGGFRVRAALPTGDGA